MTCHLCDLPAAHRCGGCKALYYCCMLHHSHDWPAHKPFCRFVKNLVAFFKGRAELEPLLVHNSAGLAQKEVAALFDLVKESPAKIAVICRLATRCGLRDATSLSPRHDDTIVRCLWAVKEDPAPIKHYLTYLRMRLILCHELALYDADMGMLDVRLQTHTLHEDAGVAQQAIEIYTALVRTGHFRPQPPEYWEVLKKHWKKNEEISEVLSFF